MSPLFWAILVDDVLVKLIAESFYCLEGFANDLAVVVKGRFANTLSESIYESFKTFTIDGIDKAEGPLH